MSAFSHKGYHGSAEYEDGYLVLKVLHVDDSISTHVTDTSKAKEAFADLVDDYLETCRELGREPARPCKGSFNVRVGPDLHKAALHAAVRRNQSLNSWVCEAISRQLASDMADSKKDKEWLESFRQSQLVSVSKLVGSRQLEPIQVSRQTFGSLRTSSGSYGIWHEFQSKRIV
ncbi:MAG: type II toxin-antitoxin system HicB family antitoxin [Methyloceanibacter sp.]